MLLRVALFGFLSLALAAAAEFDDTTPFNNIEPRLWGRPARIVAPEFPDEARAAGHTGYVEVRYRVGPLGEAQDATYQPDSPESATFADAVKAVLPYWSFHVPQAGDCMPSTQQVAMRVWFELENGKPHISVEPKTTFPPLADEKMEVLEQVDPLYPKKMVVAGRKANAYARMEIDGRGNVTAVTVRTYPESLPDSFSKSVESALREWKFSPLAEGAPSRSRSACQWILFRVHD